MTNETEILIDGVELLCIVDFDYFKEDGEVTINFNSIKHGDLEVSELVSFAELDKLKFKCEILYESTAFEYWEQRYEERNSGLAREL